MDDFYLFHGVCHRPKPNCVLMKGSNCEVCKIGYRRVDGHCLLCHDMEGGFVHCHEECDISNTKWHSTVDSTWVNVNKTGNVNEGNSHGSILSLSVLLISLLVSLIM